MPAIDHLECASCKHCVAADGSSIICPVCAGTLLVRYDMEALRQTARRGDIPSHAAASAASIGIWRYASVLPDVEPVTLGEGGTPLLRSRRYPKLFIKQEGANPTGSAHARGVALAVAMAKHRGVRHLAAACESEDAVALAAYAAAAGLSAHIFMPRDAFQGYIEAVAYGAEMTPVDGTLADCAHALHKALKTQAEGATDPWLDLSAANEPFRLEGMKTLGYELAEQMGWCYPDAVFYPAADDAALLGMRKAFDEMEQLGWVSGERPTLYAVRAASNDGELIDDPFAIVTIDAEAGMEKTLDWARQEGILLSPEGAAAIVAYDRLLVSGELKATDTVVLIDPTAGLKDSGEIAKALRLRPSVTLPASAKVGGIITPI